MGKLELPWDLDELHRLCRLRSTLESFAVGEWRKSADRADSLKIFQHNLEQLHQFAIRGDYPRFQIADRELHRNLIKSCRLPALLRSWEIVISDLNEWIHHVQNVYWPSLMALYREHVFLLEAWQSPDDWVAEESTHQHLEGGWYRLAATLQSSEQTINPVDRATAFISTHFASEISIPWIASYVSYVSTSHLNRLFREKLGISPNAFLKRIRLERAAELLGSTPDTVAVLARRVGYKNVSHFGRDFNKHFAVSPLKYRQTRKPPH